MVAAYMNFLILVMVTFTAGSLYDPFANQDLEQMKKLVDILHEKLISEDCQQPNKTVIKTDLLETSSEGIQLEAYLEFYEHHVHQLQKGKRWGDNTNNNFRTNNHNNICSFACRMCKCHQSY